MNIGELIATLGVDTTGLDKARKDMQKFETDLNRIGDAMIKTGKKMSLFVTAPIVAAGAYSFKMAADVVEAVNKVDVAFKRDAEEVKKWSETSLKSYGMAKRTALDMVALFGDMATSMGLNTQRAAAMSMNLAGLAADLASFKNIRVEVAQTALAGIFTGETESLKKLGIVMTEVNLQEFALSQGIKKKYSEMIQAEKVMLRYNYILEVTKNSQGDFERTSDSAANQLRMFHEGIKDVAATFGEVLIPIITPMLVKLNDFLLKIKDLDEGKKKWVIRIAAVAAAIGPLLIIIGSLIKIIPVLTMAFKALTIVMSANPIFLVVTAIAALTAGLFLFKKRARESVDANDSFNKSLQETEEIINKRKIEEFLRSAGILVQVQKQIAPGMFIVSESIDNTSQSLDKLRTAISVLGTSELKALADMIDSQIIEMKRSLEGVNLSGVLFGDLAKKRGELQNLQNALILMRQELEKIDKMNSLSPEREKSPKKLTSINSIEGSPFPVSSKGYDDIQRALNQLQPAMQQNSNSMAEQMQIANEMGIAMGGAYDFASAAAQIYQQQLEVLISQGYTSEDEAVQQLINRLKELGVITEGTFTEVMNKVSNVVQQVGSQVMTALSSWDQLLVAQRDKKLKGLQDYAEKSGKTEEWLAKRQDQINREYARKRKNIAYAQALINGAMAITSILSTGGGTYYADGGIMAAVLSAIVVGTTAMQIATIKAQEFAEGGIVPPGYPGDSYPARLTSGEMVIPAQKLPDLSGLGGISEEKYEKLIKEQTAEIVNGIMNAPVPIMEGDSIVGFQQGLNKIYMRNKKFRHARGY